MFADYHVHTEFSDDSIYLMEDVIRDAVNMNMDEICITDHVDYGVKDDWDSGSEIIYRNGEPLANVDYPSYMDKIQFLKRKYAGKIRIKTGMEFGVQAHTIPQFEDLFTRYPILLSCLSIRWKIKSSGHRNSRRAEHRRNIMSATTKRCFHW